jgi:hypothetical protein
LSFNYRIYMKRDGRWPVAFGRLSSVTRLR